MRYRVILTQCDDARRAGIIADYVARRTGAAPEAVRSALARKSLCIRKDAPEEEAFELLGRFKALGADVRLEEVPAVPPPAYAPRPEPPIRPPEEDGDTSALDEDDDTGRILTGEEYARKLCGRPDIFRVERESRLRNLELVSVVCATAMGLWLSARTIEEVTTDFLEEYSRQRPAQLLPELPESIVMRKPDNHRTPVANRKKPGKRGTSAERKQPGGGGDFRERITKQGVLGLISGQIKGKTVASADIFGAGGFVTAIDAMFEGLGGLKTGRSGGAGRKGLTGIGFGTGHASGFAAGGRGGGGLGDFVSGLMTPDRVSALNLKRRASIEVRAPAPLAGGALTGARTMGNIRRVVFRNLAALRHVYNKRLREKPGLRGKITVKFAIDEFGRVVHCRVVASSIQDPTLLEAVLSTIRRWSFGKVDRPGDVTEVVYPFAFSQ